jgi:hypothetical protein
MATLALKAINYGADKIPDKAFHAVPGGYFRPEGEENPLKKSSGKKKKGKDRDRGKDRERQRDGGDRDGDRDGDREDDRNEENERHSQRQRPSKPQQESSESESSDSDEEQKIGHAPPRRRTKRYQRSSDLDRGYNSDQGGTPDGYAASRGPPPGVDYFPPPPRQAVDAQNLHEPQPYSPHDYAASPGNRDQYYAGHPLERQPYDPVNYQQPVSLYFWVTCI